MGFHSDVKYSKSGEFSYKQNSVIENTATVIYTVGYRRALNWRQKIFDTSNKTKININFNLTMLLDEGSMLILHPHDERPHFDSKTNTTVKYEHGKVTIKKNLCSIAFVFRVCSRF